MDNFIFTFFDSIGDYISFNQILFVTLGIFLFTIFIVLFTTATSYESKLIRSIDMFNTYFSNNPQLTEDNLLHFNSMMKSSRVPRLICKQWQQFVLYRENKASAYLSYEVCVNSPLKNSSFKRDIKIMNYVAYIVAIFSFAVNMFHAYELDVVTMFQYSFLAPAIVLLLNWLFTLILNIRYNAIVNDINQNFSYFQTNMDKATQTIPEYVDYEVLFDKNEIKRGIPILYAYLQKRAEDEKRELERARLKNVEHEKFNFDEAGVESSLVLERAMQEAENYIAERKKYLEDTSQVNNEINQEDLNYREITKEYQRQMQVSKESFNNFRDQLNEVSSTIEANYLKKQQQQELDRQRNLERDYDAATERHKKAIEALQKELTELEKTINSSREALEKGMMSEFATYGSKVYDAAHKLATYREHEKIDDLKKEIKQLEEKIVMLTQNKPEDNDDGGNSIDKQFEFSSAELNDAGEAWNENAAQNSQDEETYAEQEQAPQAAQPFAQQPTEQQPENAKEGANEEDWSFNFDDEDDEAEDVQENVIEQSNSDKGEQDDEDSWVFDAKEDTNSQQTTNQPPIESDAPSAVDAGWTFNYLDEPTLDQVQSADQVQPQPEAIQPQPEAIQAETASTSNTTNAASETPAETQQEEPISTPKPRKKAGRPRKIVSPEELNKPKRPRGRPKKEISTEEINKPKRPRGRPKKEEQVVKPQAQPISTTIDEPTKRRGRPRKVIIIEEAEPVKEESNQKAKRGRPRKITVQQISSDAELPSSVSDIDEYLKAIDNQIAEENLKIEQTQKELEKNTKISRRKK